MYIINYSDLVELLYKHLCTLVELGLILCCPPAADVSVFVVVIEGYIGALYLTGLAVVKRNPLRRIVKRLCK